MTYPRQWIGTNPPSCDFCRHDENIIDTFYDAATELGPWAVMCPVHYRAFGLPMGQEYKLTNGVWLKTRNLNGQPDRPTLDDENAEMARAEREEKS